MHLHYDAYVGRYVGVQVSVDETTLFHALQRLILAGSAPEEALTQVLEESFWRLDTAGVSAMPSTLRCHHCRRVLPPLRQSFCDAVCEAARCVLERG